MEKVEVEINRLHSLFMSRNPNFKGKVSVAGHSLGKAAPQSLMHSLGCSDVELCVV